MLSGVFWSYLNSIASQLIAVVVSIVLARLLTPSDFGLLAIVNVLITLLGVAVENGLNVSLIQKQNVREIDYSTVFYINTIASILLYVCLFFAAPYFSMFYQIPSLTSIIRVLGIRIIISGCLSTHRAIIIKRIDFKLMFSASIWGAAISGFFGILLAYLGYGVWALVWQTLISSSVISIMTLRYVKWRPTKAISLGIARTHFSYGWRIVATEFITSLFVNVRSLLIGKLYSTEALAFYTQGQKIPDLLMSSIGSSLSSTLFPVLSSLSEDTYRVKLAMKRTIKMSAYLLFPLFIGLAIVAEPLIVVLLTNKWVDSVPYLRIICIVYLTMPFNSVNYQAIKAIGRSDLFLRTDLLKKTVSLVVLGISLSYGVLAIAISSIIDNIFTTILNAFPIKKTLKYGLLEQIKDVIVFIPLCLIMGVVVWLTSCIPVPMSLSLLIQVIAGVFAYITASHFFKVSEYFFIVKALKDLYNRKRKGRQEL